MKSAVAYLSKQNPLMVAAGAALVLGVVYFLARKTLQDVAEVGAGLATGNNAITRNQTNAAGEKVDAYEGAGVVGTAGAAANSVSGGFLATAGQKVGGWLYDITHLDAIE